MSNIPNETKDSQAPVKEFFDNYFNETLTFPGADVIFDDQESNF